MSYNLSPSCRRVIQSHQASHRVMFDVKLKPVRTTLDLEDDVLAIVRQLAQQRESTIGHVVSDLIRQAVATKSHENVRNGVILFSPKPGAPKPTLALVNELRD